MPGLLTLLRRCISSSEFEIKFTPSKYKFSCPSCGLYLTIELHRSGFLIDYSDTPDADVFYVKYKVPKSQKLELPTEYLTFLGALCTGNRGNPVCFRYAEMFYRLYFHLVNDYVYSTLSSIKPSQIHVKSCSEHLIETNLVKLSSYPFLDFYLDNVLNFTVTGHSFNYDISKIITPMLNKLEKFDCNHPKRYIMLFISYAKALL